MTKAQVSRRIKQLRRELVWRDRQSLMLQRSPTPQVQYVTRMFALTELHKGKTAEDVWPGVFCPHLSREQREANLAAE